MNGNRGSGPSLFSKWREEAAVAAVLHGFFFSPKMQPTHRRLFSGTSC